MKILIAAPLKRKITPDVTASRPRIIYELVNGLIKKGHQVSILGTGDSIVPGATIIPIIEKGYSELPAAENPFYAETSYLVTLAKKIEQIASNFDIIHNHTYPEFINLLINKNISTPMVTTIHAQATKELDNVLSLFNPSNFVSISRAHQSQFIKTQVKKVIYNGIDVDLFPYSENKDDYLLWVGRLSKAKNSDGSFMDPKGIKWAIQLARETNNKLIMTGNIEDMDFYNQEVKPYLTDKIQWFGPLSAEQTLSKQQIARLMSRAKVFLMTINWFEPFGLVMAEAMSSGTPVIGFDRGAVSEIISEGKTGFIVDPTTGIDGLKNALSKISSIKPTNCRNHIVKNFSTMIMVNNYEKYYSDSLCLSA